MVIVQKYKAYWVDADDIEEVLDHVKAELTTLYGDTSNFVVTLRAKPSFNQYVNAPSKRKPGKFNVTIKAKRSVSR